jgi:hypothetical protein
MERRKDTFATSLKKLLLLLGNFFLVSYYNPVSFHLFNPKYHIHDLFRYASGYSVSTRLPAIDVGDAA